MEFPVGIMPAREDVMTRLLRLGHSLWSSLQGPAYPNLGEVTRTIVDNKGLRL